jgi:hypothetical protein
MSGPFVLLEFPINGSGHASEPPTIYVDGFTGALFLDKQHEVDRYGAAFKDIWNAASPEADSRNTITAAARELRQ